MVFFVWYGIPDIGLEKGGTSAHTGVKQCPVDTVLARGRVLLVCGCRLMPVDASQFMDPPCPSPRKVRLFFLSRGKPLAVDQSMGLGPISSTIHEKSELLHDRKCVRIFCLYQRHFILMLKPRGFFRPPGSFS